MPIKGCIQFIPKERLPLPPGAPSGGTRRNALSVDSRSLHSLPGATPAWILSREGFYYQSGSNDNKQQRPAQPAQHEKIHITAQFIDHGSGNVGRGMSLKVSLINIVAHQRPLFTDVIENLQSLLRRKFRTYRNVLHKGIDVILHLVTVRFNGDGSAKKHRLKREKQKGTTPTKILIGVNAQLRHQPRMSTNIKIHPINVRRTPISILPIEW